LPLPIIAISVLGGTDKEFIHSFNDTKKANAGYTGGLGINYSLLWNQACSILIESFHNVWKRMSLTYNSWQQHY